MANSKKKKNRFDVILVLHVTNTSNLILFCTLIQNKYLGCPGKSVAQSRFDATSSFYLYDVSLSLDLKVRRECLMLANVTENPSVDGRWLGGIVFMQQTSSFHPRESF